MASPAQRMGSGLLPAEKLGKEVLGADLDAHARSHLQDAAHLAVSEGIGMPLFTDGVGPDTGSLGQTRLRPKAGGVGQMVNDIIGHKAIISDCPIIATPDLSDEGRYFIGHKWRMDTIGERVKAARKERGMTQGDLGKALGVVQSVISDIENGKLKSWPTHRNAIRRILGKPLSYFEPEEADLPTETDVHSDLSNVVMLPEYDVSLSAGDGFYVGAETTKREWPYPRFLVVDQLGVSPRNATVQEIVGDSMEPTLSSGDYVLIDMADKRIGLPGIFAVWDGDALVCKRVERIPGSEPREVRLKSDNPLHGEYRVPEEQVNIVGRIRWITRRA